MVLKKIMLLCFMIVSIGSFAQKFGYIESEKILQKMPAYSEAQKEIDKISVEYQKEIENMYVQLDSMFQKFREEEILLTEEMKQKRQKEIMDKEKEIKEYQRKIFGFEGLIFLKRQELIKPLQDEVFEAVKKVARKNGLQVIFDKSSDLQMIYASKTHDYTDYVLEELELKEAPEPGKGK